MIGLVGALKISNGGSLTRVGRVIWPVSLALSVPYFFAVGAARFIGEMVRGD